jgi:hypothetical protein
LLCFAPTMVNKRLMMRCWASSGIKLLSSDLASTHIDNSERLNARPRRVDPEQGSSVPGIMMKQSEEVRGSPLAKLAVKA